MLFNPARGRAVKGAEPVKYAALEGRFNAEIASRDTAARTLGGASRATEAAALAAFRSHSARADSVRTEALDLARTVTGHASNDVNYIMPRFALDFLPFGLS